MLCCKKKWKEPSALKLWNPGCPAYEFPWKKLRFSSRMVPKVRHQGPPRLLEQSLGTTVYSIIKKMICEKRRTPKKFWVLHGNWTHDLYSAKTRSNSQFLVSRNSFKCISQNNTESPSCLIITLIFKMSGIISMNFFFRMGFERLGFYISVS